MFGNVMNIFGNWILIYGKMGLPEMGLLGAGISTLLSRALILVLFALYIWKSKDFKDYVSAFRASLLSRVEMKHLFGIGYPVAVQMALETSTFSFAAIMAGWLGVMELAAHQVVITISQLFS